MKLRPESKQSNRSGSRSTGRDRTLEQGKELLELGLAVQLNRPGSKRPANVGWSKAPPMTTEQFADGYLHGENISVRTGMPSKLDEDSVLVGVDVDMRSDDPVHHRECEQALRAWFGDSLEHCPVALSGSGGGSKHIYFQVPIARIPASQRIATSKEKVTIPTSSGPKEKPAWEIDLMSTGKSLMLPPSTHPETDRQYEWRRHPREGIPWMPEAALQRLCTNRSGSGQTIGILRSESVQPVDIESCGLGGKWVRLIQGDGIENYESRSEALFAAMGGCVDAGLSNAQICQILTNPEYPISEKALEKPNPDGWLIPQINKIRESRTSKEVRTSLRAQINSTTDQDELLSTRIEGVATSVLTAPAKEQLYRRIARKADVTLQSVRGQANAYQRQAQADEEISNHRQSARAVIAHFGDGNIICVRDQIYVWTDTGIWSKPDARALRRVIQDNYPEDQLSKNTVESIFDLAKTDVHVDGNPFLNQGKIINCRNGELHHSGEEWVLQLHDKHSYSVVQFPVLYDPEANAPRFTRFLDEIFLDDPEVDLKKSVLLEAIGYSLIPTTKFEKFFLLVGSGANGKSVMLSVLEALVGRDNVCAVQPSQLDQRFSLAHLQGKTVNIVTEVAEGEKLKDAKLKSLVSGELQTAEHKFAHPFDFVPTCKHWFATNHMPHNSDFSEALYRRAIVIRFNQTFTGTRCNPNLVHELRQELPGILNMALQALAGLLERGEFTATQETANAIDEWRLDSDQVAQFVEECCERGQDYDELSGMIYHIYEQWAARSGIKSTVNRNRFTKRLTSLGFSKHKGGGGVRVLQGLRVTEQARKAYEILNH